jgi:drug/metabolite transporter (DMT)-like permease
MTSQPESTHDPRRVTSGILFSSIAALAFATNGFIANNLVDGGVPGIVVGFFEGSFGFALVLLVNARNLGGRPRVDRTAMLWIALASAGFALAFASFYTALSRIDYSVGAPILGTVPLFSYIVILFVLRGEERITPRALAGAAMIVVGVGIIGATA